MKLPKQHGPLLSSTEEHPGRFVDGKWSGPLDWCTEHGPAIVQWSVGLPTYVWNASGAGGARVNLRGRYPSSDLFRVDANGPIISGRISIAPGDVEFAVVDDPAALDIEEPLLALFNLLRADPAFSADLASPAFAAALYAVIENEEFVGNGAAVFEFGQRSAAHFVAALREVGEDYLDFAWGRGPAFTQADADHVRAHFERLGIALREIE